MRCDASETCSGRVRLKTRGARTRTLGTKRIAIGAGDTSTVKVRLSKRNRRRIKAGGLKVTIEVDLGSNGTTTRDVTLRRKQ